MYALLGTMGSTIDGFAQAPQRADTLFLNVDKDLASQLLPFDDIYGLALHNSPLLKQQDAEIESKAAATESLKWVFLRGVGIATSLSRGNQSVTTSDNSSYPLLSLSNGYRLAFNANFSIGELLGRRSTIKQAQSDQKSAIAKRDVLSQELRRELYRVYQATLLSQRMLQLFIQGEQVALVAFQTAEIGWKENRLAAADYSAAARLYTEAQAKVEGERVALSTNLFDMLTLAGVPMAQLHRLPK